MSYESVGDASLDYAFCHYGESKLQFRGPKQPLKGDFIAFLGGTETFGKFIPVPFPYLVQKALKRQCVNFGQVNAGIDVYLDDPAVLAACRRARHTVVQVMGANNLSNRYYSVHPRRNDRFLKASALMQSLFRDVDFTEFHFTRHMLGAVAQAAPERFQLIVDEVQQAWLARMELLINKLDGRVILLWFADHSPDDAALGTQCRDDPFAVTRWMIERLAPKVEDVVEVAASAAALARGPEGMVFGPMDAPAARGMLGPAAHKEAARALVRALKTPAAV